MMRTRSQLQGAPFVAMRALLCRASRREEDADNRSHFPMLYNMCDKITFITLTSHLVRAWFHAPERQEVATREELALNSQPVSF